MTPRKELHLPQSPCFPLSGPPWRSPPIRFIHLQNMNQDRCRSVNSTSSTNSRRKKMTIRSKSVYLLWKQRTFCRHLPRPGKRTGLTINQAVLPGTACLSPASLLSLPTTIVFKNVKLPISALVDSGAKQNLISSDIVAQLQLPTVTLNHPRTVAGITGKPITQINAKIPGLHLIISGNHHERGEFLFLSPPLLS